MDNNWDNMLKAACSRTGDDYVNIITTLTPDELREYFDTGLGGSRGLPFTAWGDKYVYFPVVYDGAEWVGYAPRNPCDVKTAHQGGE